MGDGLRFALLLALFGGAQAQDTLLWVDSLQFPTRPSGCSDSLVLHPRSWGLSDVWGYVDADGDEYAVATALNEVAVVKLPEMQVVGSVPAPVGGTDCYGYQRVARTYGHHLYVTNDGFGINQGMMILDLAGLDSTPRSIRYVKSYAPDSLRTFNHTFDLDTVQGYAYIAHPALGRFRIVNLADPENPVEVTEVLTGTIHDLTVGQGRNRLYVATGDDGYSVYDVSDKSNPIRLARFSRPDIGYSHNIWPTEDGAFAFTTDEIPNSPVRVWDLDAGNGYANPSAAGQWLGGNLLAHNVQVRGNRLFVAHYSYGVAVLDISNPAIPILAAHYDTYPESNQPGYFGSFGVWISPRGTVVTDKMDKGVLQVLRYAVGPSLSIRRGFRRGSFRFRVLPPSVDALGRKAIPLSRDILFPGK